MKKITIFIFLVVLNLTVAFVCKGQNNTNELNSKKLLIVKFEKAIEINEPKFTGGKTGESGEHPLELISSLFWKFEESIIDVYVEDFYSESDSIKYFKLNYTENLASPLRIWGIKLTNLGDEAWMLVTEKGRKNGRTQLVLRKGTVKIFLRATSSTLAIRFAEYLVQVVEKHQKKKSL